MKTLSRILLAISALLLAVGGCLHTLAFNRVSAGVAKSDLAPFLGNGLKVLWLQDSIITFVLAIIFAPTAIRPSFAKSTVIILLALVLLTTALLIYYFIGSFVGGHVFLAAANCRNSRRAVEGTIVGVSAKRRF